MTATGYSILDMCIQRHSKKISLGKQFLVSSSEKCLVPLPSLFGTVLFRNLLSKILIKIYGKNDSEVRFKSVALVNFLQSFEHILWWRRSLLIFKESGTKFLRHFLILSFLFIFQFYQIVCEWTGGCISRLPLIKAVTKNSLNMTFL